MFDRHFAVWPEQVPRELELPATNLYHNITVSALRYPEHPAIHYYGTDISYRELQDQTERLAGYLQQAGVQAGDRVLLYMQNSPQYIIGYFAILRANAVVVPVNPMNRTAELAYLIEDTQAPVALCGQELSEFVAPHIGEGCLREVIVSAYNEYVQQPTDLTLPDVVSEAANIATANGVSRWQDALKANLRPGPLTAGPSDLCVIPYSSGTTGNPKGCVHTHHSVMATTVYGAAWVNTQHSCIHLVSVPMFHVTGMQSCMNSTLYAGGTLVVMTRWDRKVAAALIEKLKINTWRNISTMVVDMLSDPDIDKYDISSLTGIGGGGRSHAGSRSGQAQRQDRSDLYGRIRLVRNHRGNPRQPAPGLQGTMPWHSLYRRGFTCDRRRDTERSRTWRHRRNHHARRADLPGILEQARGNRRGLR